MTTTSEDAENEEFFRYLHDHVSNYSEEDRRVAETKWHTENITVINPEMENIYKSHVKFFKDCGFINKTNFNSDRINNISMAFEANNRVVFSKKSLGILRDIMMKYTTSWSIEARNKNNTPSVNIEYILEDGIITKKVK